MCRSKSVWDPSLPKALPGDPSHLKCPIQMSEFSVLPQPEHTKQKNGCANPTAFAMLGDTKLKSLNQWTADEVASWLIAVGLVNCAAKVKSHDIAGDVAGDVTVEDAADMGLKEIDCYRLIRALGELQTLVDDVWQRPNQLSDRLKQDSLQNYRMKLNQTNTESELLRENKRCKQDFHEYHHEYHQARRKIEADCTEAEITKVPLSPQTPLLLPIKKRVRFNDEVERFAL